MHSITCIKCGAVLKTKAPVAAGKKLKCPKCEKVFVVEAEEEKEEKEAAEDEDTGGEKEETPMPKKRAEAPRDDEEEGDENESKDEEEDEEEERPKKKHEGKKKSKGDGKAKKGSPMLLLVGAGAALLLLLLVGGGGFAGWYFCIRDPGPKKDDLAKKQGGDDGAGGKDGKDVKDAPKIVITGEDLAKQLRTGGKTTLKQYEGKILEVTDEVDKLLDRSALSLKGADTGKGFRQPVYCTVPPQLDGKFVRLSRGQKVKIVCKLDPESGKFGVSTLTELEPSKIAVVPAEMFTDEMLANPKATAQKYAETYGLIVSGAIAEFNFNFNKQRTGVKMRASGISYLDIDFFKDSNGGVKDLAPVQLGDEVEVRCIQPNVDGNRIALGGGILVRKIRSGTPVDLKAEFTLTAEEFATAKNKQQYQDKRLEITGEVYSLAGCVRLKGTLAKKGAIPALDVYDTVDCYYQPEYLAKAQRFSEGQKIKAVGKATLLRGAFELFECKLTELEPSNLPNKTAESLAKEGEDGKLPAKAVQSRFIVAGIVESVTRGKKSPVQCVITLTGTGKTRVKAHDYVQDEKLIPKAGDRIELRAVQVHYDRANNEVDIGHCNILKPL